MTAAAAKPRRGWPRQRGGPRSTARAYVTGTRPRKAARCWVCGAAAACVACWPHRPQPSSSLLCPRCPSGQAGRRGTSPCSCRPRRIRHRGSSAREMVSLYCRHLVRVLAPSRQCAAPPGPDCPRPLPTTAHLPGRTDGCHAKNDEICTKTDGCYTGPALDYRSAYEAQESPLASQLFALVPGGVSGVTLVISPQFLNISIENAIQMWNLPLISLIFVLNLKNCGESGRALCHRFSRPVNPES